MGKTSLWGTIIVTYLTLLFWGGGVACTGSSTATFAKAEAGAGGEAGQGGEGGEAGQGGEGGEAGQGGEGGEAGQGGEGGEAGQGGQGGTAGAGGQGGQGGSGGSFPTCVAGNSGTVDNISAQGVNRTGFLLHYDSGAEYYTQSHPATLNFNNEPMPGQMVLAGEDGVQFALKNAANPEAKVWYRATNLPNADCGGVDGLQTEACLSVVAKSFRCQFAPYLETLNCPVVVVNFAAEPAASLINEAGPAGWQIILVDLTCP
jgi:hypothetical protein